MPQSLVQYSWEVISILIGTKSNNTRRNNLKYATFKRRNNKSLLKNINTEILHSWNEKSQYYKAILLPLPNYKVIANSYSLHLPVSHP